jgi:molybdopterin-containing oxidoreductase family iron-sulfur binding subunit
MNPDVTVRARGVMEKCTYCVQRIREAEIRAGREHRPLADGEVVTACQQTCPTEAIIFGDIADPGTRVAKTRESSRLYQVLQSLGTLPRTRYLARVVNPNSELARS